MLSGKELMIGDYVNIAEYDFPQVIGVVREIHADGEEVLVSCVDDDKDKLTLNDEYIHELFLSKTFFLENGFEELRAFDALHINETYSLLCNVDIKVAVKIMHENNFRCEVYGIEMNYVHEFQHLMRLLGLYDYANNLKI